MIDIPASQLDLYKHGGSEYTGYRISNDVKISGQNSLTMNFSNSEFLGNFTAIPGKYLSLVCENSVFFETVTINAHEHSLSLNFKNATFKKGLSIVSKNKVWLDMSFVTVFGKVELCDLSNLTHGNFEKLKFDSFTLDDKFIFKNNSISIADFNESILSNAVFNDTTFQENISFDRACLHYSQLPATGNFWHVKFMKDVYFNGTEINKGVFFNGAEFHESALFLGVNKNVESVANFSAAKFYKRSFFDECSFDRIVFNNCEFTDIVSFKGLVANDLQISKAIFLKGADFLNAQIHNADRETFRIVKNEFLKINNQVEALHYRSKEMRAYEKEISGKKNTSEYVLLWLNKLSTNHGLSWWKGIKFTVIIAIFFYCVYLLTLSDLPFKWGYTTWSSFLQASGKVFEYFLRFFIVTHDLDFMNKFHPSAISYFVDILAKIFIGYGLYQTVQAFRKYGKS